jgi:multiple RNA-binding domain-containing protein 1
VYQPPSKNNAWTNGDTQIDVPAATAEQVADNTGAKEDESDDDYQVIAKKPKPTIDAATPVSVVKPVTDTPVVETLVDTTMQDKPDLEGGEDSTTADQGPVSDADWLRSRTNRILDLVADDEEPTSDAPPPKVPREQRASPQLEAEPIEQPVDTELSVAQQLEVPTSTEVEKIRETGRLYLRNLHYEIAEEDLREHFSKYGALEEVRPTFFFLLPTIRAMMNIHDRDN